MISRRPVGLDGMSTASDITVHSADGTTIACTRRGTGPAVILIDGALCHRAMGPNFELGGLLSERGFTTYVFDRRGRGASGATAPYAVAREVEDVAAVLEAAGGSATLFGISSGAALALETAAVCDGVSQVVCFEPPFIVDDTKSPLATDFIERLQAHVAAGRHGAAVRQFLAQVGMPRPMIRLMALTPMWKKLTATAPTLPYDMSIVGAHQQGTPLDGAHWAGIAAPVTVIDGGKSPAWMRNGNRHLAEVLGADYETLPGQTHMVKPKVLAPALAAILARVPASA
jgi:pimeloyl-ACP methyl ester carboxylesterase